MKRFLPIIIFIFLLEILIIPFILKMDSLRFLIIPNEETHNHLLMQVITHDSMIYALIILFIYLSYLKKVPKLLLYFFRILAVTIFLIYLIDIFILKNFVTHININDLFKYITYVPKYIEQEYHISFIDISLFLIVASFIFYFIKFDFKMLKKHHSFFIISLLSCLYVNSFSEDDYVHSWAYKNFIEYNIDLLEQSKDYSNKLKKELKIDDHIRCSSNTPLYKNILVVMVESLASYQSNYFSGIKDWTPNLDKIAESNINIKNFISNGFVTEDAEISILTGLFPIYAPKVKANLGSTAFQGFYSIKNSLPNYLNKKGYSTQFMTSSDLNFSNTGEWAKSIGFKYIEGSKHPFYNNKRRYHFDAVADEYLFKRVLTKIENNKKDTPYFIFVKTVSSHIPFLNPEDNTYSEEKTIRYVDKQLGLLYKNLKKINFFYNGLLIIVGDHHPMVPIKKEQIDKYGLISAGLRVPFIASLGDTKKETINENFHQVDIYNSIKNLTSKESCTSSWMGDFLSTPYTPSKFTLYRRGDKRGIITVFNQNRIYNLRLNGDNTGIIDQRESFITKTIIDKINFERIQREKNSL